MIVVLLELLEHLSIWNDEWRKNTMKIVKPGVDFITPINGTTILKRLEECGRVCYKSEGRITVDSALPLLPTS